MSESVQTTAITRNELFEILKIAIEKKAKNIVELEEILRSSNEGRFHRLKDTNVFDLIKLLTVGDVIELIKFDDIMQNQ